MIVNIKLISFDDKLKLTGGTGCTFLFIIAEMYCNLCYRKLIQLSQIQLAVIIDNGTDSL